MLHDIHPGATGVDQAEAALSPPFVLQRIRDGYAGFFQALEAVSDVVVVAVVARRRVVAAGASACASFKARLNDCTLP